MSSRTFPLSEAIKIKHGFAFPGDGFGVDPCGPQLLTPGNFAIGGGFQNSKVKSYSGNFPSEYTLSAGQLVVTMTDLSKNADTLGLPAVVPADRTYLHNQRVGLVEITDPTRIDLEFLGYYLRTSSYRSYIVSTATGSTVRHTSPGRIGAFVATVPPVGEQQAIAEVLGALDDKIAANTAQTISLDELSLTLFSNLAASAPNRVPLGELGSFVRGVSYRSADLVHSSTAMVTLKSFERSGGYATRGLKSYAGAFREDQVLTNGEIAMAMTDLTQAADVVGRAVRVPVSSRFRTLVPSLDVALVRPRKGVPSEFLLGVLNTDRFRQYCRAHTSGTTVLHLAANALPNYEAPQVDSATQRNFAATARPICALQDSLQRENEILAELRDTLLPQLMSGVLRVRDAGAIVSEAV